MYLTSGIVKDTLAARRFRMVAPPRRTARARGPDPGASHQRDLTNRVTAVGAIPPRTLPPSGRAALDRVNPCYWGHLMGGYRK